MSRRIVGPFNRVEGDLEVHLDVQENRVADAWVVSPLYRGFEQILQGKNPRDALVYTPRICGICSVAQSAAAAAALADLQGMGMPPNGRLATNLVSATENVADHLTHFYLFFMPDFARDIYAGEPWFETTASRFKAVTGAAAAQVLPPRAEFMHLMGLLAGKWPHSLAIQPGGTTRPVDLAEKSRMVSIMFGFRRFLEDSLFGDSLESISSLDSAESLQDWFESESPEQGDFRRFLRLASELGLADMGRGPDRFMSYGVYPGEERPLFKAGVWTRDSSADVDAGEIAEDLSHCWMVPGQQPLHPYEGMTRPDADAAGGYTWCKAPRLAGQVVEVGALARQVIDGHPLALSLVAESGGNVRNRVVARLLEIARVVMAMERWVKAIQPGESFSSQAERPAEGRGRGLIEAARGSLGHWLTVKDGRIDNYQIISPTTWNFSPRDQDQVPGALEQALVGAPVRKGEEDPVAVQHIVRSFDPCMVCTVH